MRAPGEITLITPTIPGREEMLERAIRSVLRQRQLPDFMMVMLDVHRMGCAEMKNAMVCKSSTEWVAFLDDDDELLPNHIETLMRAAHIYPQCDLFYTWFEPVGMTDPLACPDDAGQMKNPLGIQFGERQQKHLLEVDNFIPCTVMLRADAMLKVGGFQKHKEPPTPVYDRDDLGLWRAMLQAGSKFRHIPEVTWRYHHHQGHTGGSPPEETKQWQRAIGK